jgi:hypothetical protein
MVGNPRVMYDRFSDKGGHSIEWVGITKNFLNLAFVGGRCVAKSLCKKCGNYKMLPQYDMQGHLAKHGFITTRNLTVYDILWCQKCQRKCISKYLL